MPEATDTENDTPESIPTQDSANENDKDRYLEYMVNLADAYQRSLKQWLEVTEGRQILLQGHNPMDIFNDIMGKLLEKPEQLYSKQLELLTNYTKVWGNVLGRYLGENNTPLYVEDTKDRRFKDSAWKENVVFDFIKQSYLLTSQWSKELVNSLDSGTEADPEHRAELYKFYTQQFIDAISPSNFAFTNPEVLKETLDTKGENLIKGFQNLVEDLDHSGKFLNIRTTDMNFFKVGSNIAATPGKVMYRNDLMELIQYQPTQAQTFERPLLLIPAWINKYYIFDLTEKNSFVVWLLEQGYTVFVISWVNPDKEHSDKKFEDYMLQGPLAALDAIEKATGSKEVTALGYCLGGTLLTATLAHMKAKGDDRIKAATFLTTLVDFAQAGDMSLFVSKEQLERLDAYMNKTGYLDGSEMAGIFSVLRANDLIWSFVVNNYLLGREPFPFDILYWNADATRLPAATHSFYMHNMYFKNAMTKPGGITLGGTPIDVRTITTPSYIFATYEDHIAPWVCCYKSTQMFTGPHQFVLGGSGHVSGVINPPAKQKYCYWTNPKTTADSAKWLDNADRHEGSWWDHWNHWNISQSGKKIDAPKPGSGTIKPLADAPGSYVFVRTV